MTGDSFDADEQRLRHRARVWSTVCVVLCIVGVLMLLALVAVLSGVFAGEPAR